MSDLQAGFYWARHKSNGELTVVHVTRSNGFAGVMFIGNLNWPDLDEALEFVEIIERISEPK